MDQPNRNRNSYLVALCVIVLAIVCVPKSGAAKLFKKKTSHDVADDAVPPKKEKKEKVPMQPGDWELAPHYRLNPRWRVALKGPKRDKGYRLNTASVEDGGGALFIGSLSGELIAVAKETGSVVWRAPTGGPIEGRALATETVVYIGNNKGLVSAVDRADGRLLWQTPLTDEVIARPVLSGNILYVLTTKDELIGLNRETGERVGGAALAESIRDISLRGQGNLALYGALVFVSLTEGGIVAYDSARNTIRWRQSFRTAGGRFADSDATPLLAIDGRGTVFAGSYSQGVYALDAASGTILWKHTGGTVSDFYYDRDALYVASTAGEIAALSAASGAIRWTRDLRDTAWVPTNPVAIGDRVFVGERSRGLYILDRASGAPVGKAPVPGGISARLATDGKYLYFVSNAHVLYAFEIGE